MNCEFRRDQICTTWTQEQWNEMYKATERGEKTDLVESWNTLYNTVVSKTAAIVKEYNDNYTKMSFSKPAQGGTI